MFFSRFYAKIMRKSGLQRVFYGDFLQETQKNINFGAKYIHGIGQERPVACTKLP